MNLSISNIAWDLDEDEAVAEILQDLGVGGVEIAPTKIWPQPLAASDREIAAYRAFWKSRGIRIVAMQSLLFGRPDLTIFQSAEKRVETLDHLEGIIRLGNKLGAHALVFGSPKNRRVETLSQGEIDRIALPFFQQIGEVALRNELTFCIEPNAPLYECDYVQTSREGLELVRSVDSEGFRLHLDAAAMTLCGEEIEEALSDSLPLMSHFHVSEPHLSPIGSGAVDHRRFAAVLRKLKYPNWVSIEMRATSEPTHPESVRSALEFVLGLYPQNETQ